MKSLLFLPFDHRATFADLLGFNYPVTKTQAKEISALKAIIFEAFVKVRSRDKSPEELAILVDEEFGSQILKKAKKIGIDFALTVEKSGQKIFNFEYGEKFGEHLKKFKPRWAKALVRYNPDKKEDNTLQQKRLKQLARFCKTNNILLLIELLVNGDDSRSELIKATLKQLIKAGVVADVWKLEGLDKAADWQKICELTRGSKVIVLGRGEGKRQVEKWVKNAAKSGCVDGFAIGRTIFFEALEDWKDKKITHTAAVERIAKNYQQFIELWRRSTK